MPGRLVTIWKHRHFWLALASMDLRVRYRRSIIGVGWSLLNPIVMTIVFCVAFSSWLGNGDWRTAAPSFLIGIAIWELIKQSAVQGSLTFPRNEPYIRQSPLPLAIYTLRTSAGTAIHFLITFVVAFAATAILNSTDHATPFYAILAVAPAVLLMIVFAWAIASLFAIGNVFFHDARHLAELGFGICFFLTPIIYPKERLIERGLGFVVDANPVVLFLDMIREPMLTGSPASMSIVAKAFGATFIAVVATIAVYARFERRVIFHL